MSCKVNINFLKRKLLNDVKINDDIYIKFFQIHLISLEEQFYIHLGNLRISSNDTPWISLTNKSLRHIDRIDKYALELKWNFSDLGCCFLAKDNSNGQKVVLKNILNSQTASQRHLLIQNSKILVKIQSENVVKLIKSVLFRNDNHISIWYVFEYCESITLDSFKSSLHGKVIGYEVESESEFVHMLYSCNGVLDQSRESFPNFINIIRFIAAQLLIGISDLHKHGIVLKDLSPLNIRITLKGILKITDLGLAKQYRWLQYDSRSITENVLSYVLCKDSSKRLLLDGSYFYTEPHVRSILSRDISHEEKCLQIELFGYQLDYFSCSMILFDLTLGFTYGDLSLYKKYSFFEPLINCDLIFYFPEYYIPIFDKFPNLALVLEEFSKLQLTNLKNYMMYHGDGFIDFLMEGLSTDTSRWSQFTKTVNGRHHFDFMELKNQIQFFEEFNFNDMLSNMPDDFLNLLQSFIFPNFNIMDIKRSETADVIHELDDTPNSVSFLIPEFPIHTNTSSSKVFKSILKEKQKSKSNLNVTFSSNTASKDSRSDLLRVTINCKNKSSKSQNDKEKVHTSVLVHRLFDQLHKRNSPDENLIKDKSNFKIDDIPETDDICFNESNCVWVQGKNLIEKQCPLHYNKPSCAVKNKINVTGKLKIDEISLPTENILEIHKSEKHNRGVSTDIKSISDFQLKQYRQNSTYLSNKHFHHKKYQKGRCITSQSIEQLDNDEIFKLPSIRSPLVKSVSTVGSSVLNDEILQKVGHSPIELNSICYPKNIPFDMSLKSLKTLQKLADEICKQKRLKTDELQPNKIIHPHSQPRGFQMNNLNHNVHENNLRKQFLDSSALNTPRVEPNEKKVDGTDKFHEYFENTPYTSFPILFSIPTTKTLCKIDYPLVSVTSMVSKEIQTSDEIQLNSSHVEPSWYEEKISKAYYQLFKTVIKVRLQFAVENEDMSNQFVETFDIFFETDMVNIDNILENDVTISYFDEVHIESISILCCDQNSYIMIGVNDVEESFENSETTCEKLSNLVHNSLFVADSTPCKQNLMKKSVTFKFPLTTETFDFLGFKHFDVSLTSELHLKSILKDNQEYHLKSYYLRSKVNEDNVEIIDDWMSTDESALNKELDLNTINNDTLLQSTSLSTVALETDQII